MRRKLGLVCSLLSLQKQLSGGVLIKKESLALVFSCEFCDISRNTFFYRTPQVAASQQTFAGLQDMS